MAGDLGRHRAGSRRWRPVPLSPRRRGVVARSGITIPTRWGPRLLPGDRSCRVSLDRRRLGRPPAPRHRALRAARRHLHSRRHVRRSRRRAAPPRRPRCHHARAHARLRVSRRAQLGLRRRLPLRRAELVRRTGGTGRVRRRGPRPRHGRGARRRVQPLRARRQRAPPVRAVPDRRLRHAMGTGGERRRPGERHGPSVPGGERGELDRRPPLRRAPTRRRPRHRRSDGGHLRRGTDRSRAPPSRPRVEGLRSSPSRARRTIRGSCVGWTSTGGAAMPSGTTTSTTR